MFKIYNYRDKKTLELSDTELRNYILKLTHCEYEDRPVTPERTGRRPSFLKPFLDNISKGKLLKNIFLVTAISRVNSNKETRYMFISTGNREDYLIILPFIKKYVSFIHIDCSNHSSVHEGGYLSTWFRTNMGRAFSFVDIDFLILKKEDIFLIEEKTNNGILGYGQKISYMELMTDIFTIPPTLCLAYCSPESCDLKIAKGNFDKGYKEGSLTIKKFIKWLDK